MKEAVSGHSYQRYFKTAVLFSSLIVFVFLGFKPAFSMDMTRVQAIADKLERLTGRHVKIVVENSAKPDAYLHPMGYIVITNGLMNFFEDDAEMAFVIGHEWAHIIKGHYKGGQDILGISKEISISDKLKKEMEADAYSLDFIKAAGYEASASLKVLAGLRQIMGQNGMGYSSSLQERINTLKEMLN